MNRTRLGPYIAALCALVGCAPALAAVEVEFVKPENYTDAGNDHRVLAENPAAIMKTIDGHLQELGKRCIPEGQTLHIRVLDIRLAGHVEWWHRNMGLQDVRVLRESTWPEMEVQYVWKDGTGAVLGQASDSLSAPAYLQETPPGNATSETLPYEKAMITRWFNARFCQPRPGAAATR